jgi:dihydroorotase
VPKLLVKNGKVVDPSAGRDEVLDLLISDGKVESLGKNLSAKAKTINAEGLVVCPGLVDMHVHLREPGREDEETIASGTRAACKGGFTSIVCMANTNPPADNASVIDFIKAKAEAEGVVRVYPVGAVTKGLRGEELAEMAELASAGAVAFSDDGHPVMNARVMRRALEYARMLNRVLIVHAEDVNLSSVGQMHEGIYSTLLGLQGIPAAAEEAMVARDILLAELTGARIHFAHVSTAGSVELIRGARQKGLPVTCEVTPHHLTLTDQSLASFNTNYKVNPPLRSTEDVEALQKGLHEGVIDAIATDHAPHARQEKELEFEYAPFGVIGLETALAVGISELVEKGVISLPGLIAKMSWNPCQILGLSGGTLKEGSPADLIVIDTNAQVEVKHELISEAKSDVDNFVSKSVNSPYFGWKLRGKVVHTVVDGHLIMSDGKILERVKTWDLK